MVKPKRINMINNEIGEVIHKFSVQHKVKLMGSNAFRGLLYPSDYDIVSMITEPADALAEHFQKLFKNVPFYFMDFKCGLPKLRWNVKELAKGKHSSGKLLKDAIKEDTLIKLDFILSVGSTFAECSEIYLTKYQMNKSKKQIELELEEDIGEYSVSNSMKALKRYYSLLKLNGTHMKQQNDLVSFFNSEVGLVNKVANDFEVLKMLTDKHKIPKELICSNIQMLKERLSTVDWVSLNGFEKRTIESVIAYLRSKINPIAKDFLKKIY